MVLIWCIEGIDLLSQYWQSRLGRDSSLINSAFFLISYYHPRAVKIQATPPVPRPGEEERKGNPRNSHPIPPAPTTNIRVSRTFLNTSGPKRAFVYVSLGILGLIVSINRCMKEDCGRWTGPRDFLRVELTRASHVICHIKLFVDSRDKNTVKLFSTVIILINLIISISGPHPHLTGGRSYQY